MNNPTFSFKMEIEHKKIYVWKTTQEQLVNAVQISLDLCSNICATLLARITKEELRMHIYSRMGNKHYAKTCLVNIESWQKDLNFLQTKLPYIIEHDIQYLLIDKCEQECDRAVAYRIDIPKDSINSDVMEVLHCFAKEANIIESFDICTKDYWIKPEVTIEYKSIRHIVPVKEC